MSSSTHLNKNSESSTNCAPFFSVAQDNADEQEAIDQIESQDHPHKDHQKQSFACQILRILVSLVITSLSIMFIFFPLVAIVSLIRIVSYPFSQSLKAAGFISGFINPLLAFLFSYANIFILLTCFSPHFKDHPLTQIMVLKAMVLFFSQILVTSYTRSVKLPSCFDDIFNCKSYLDNETISDYIVQINPKPSETIVDFDLNTQHWIEEYTRLLKSMHLSLDQQRFNSLFTKHQNPHSFDYRGFQFFVNQNNPLQPQTGSFIFLSILAIIKTIFAIIYIHSHPGYDKFAYLFVIALGLQTMNVIFGIIKVVSNYDLRRKTMILENLLDSMCFSGKNVNFFEKLDITSEISLETWENARRCVYDYFEEKEKKLEAVYICFMFAYFFITLVLVSTFNERFQFLFARDSIMLHPMMILSLILDFLLLSKIMLSRIYAGQRMNDIFGDFKDTLDALKGKIEDLLMRYDYYFTQCAISDAEFYDITKEQYDKFYAQKEQESRSTMKQQQQQHIKPNNTEKTQQREGKFTIYQILATKIRTNATFYINNNIDFMGEKYTTGTAAKLHIKMMNTILGSFDKITEQIHKDATTKDYKFLNLLHMEFRETLNTIVFGLISFVPAILPQLREMFK